MRGRDGDAKDVLIQHTPGSICVVKQDGEPWFVAKYICDVLDLPNVSQALIYLDDDEKQQLTTNIINRDVGGRGTLIISEAGFYSLVLRSRKPEAKAFKRWVMTSGLCLT